MIRDFITFIREQGVVGMAIGFIIGGAVGKLVASLVTDIIQPALGMLFGSLGGLNGLAWGSVMYGKFLSTAIDFVIMAAIVYFGFKLLKLEDLDKKKDALM